MADQTCSVCCYLPDLVWYLVKFFISHKADSICSKCGITNGFAAAIEVLIERYLVFPLLGNSHIVAVGIDLMKPVYM